MLISLIEQLMLDQFNRIAVAKRNRTGMDKLNRSI